MANPDVYLNLDHVEEMDDGQYKVSCPYDDEEFVSKSLDEALLKEGIYRAENHIDSSEKIDRQNDMEHTRRNIVEEWRTGENRA